jgi:hypothetical protein
MTDHSIRASTRVPAGSVTTRPTEQKQAQDAGQPLVHGGPSPARLPVVKGARVGAAAAQARTPAASPTAPAATQRARQSTRAATQSAGGASATSADQVVDDRLRAAEQRTKAEMAKLLNTVLDGFESGKFDEGELGKVRGLSEMWMTAREMLEPGSTAGVTPQWVVQDEVAKHCATRTPAQVDKIRQGIEKAQAENAAHGDTPSTRKIAEVLDAMHSGVMMHLDSLTSARERQLSRTLAEEARAQHAQRAGQSAQIDAAAAEARHEALVKHARLA